ncbi:hypothetical protein JCM10213v2_006925 [Rhodosporidiobolus nylandii]
MRSTLALFPALAALAAVVAADTTPAPFSLPPNTSPVNPPTDVSLDKRNLCILGLCIGGDLSSAYLSDVNNCGARGNRCPSSWLSGGGRQCVNGVCAPQYCNNLFDFNWLSGQCQDVSSDNQNCGKCGQTCSVANALGTKCVSGSCYATQCSSGYTLASGVCNKNIDTTSDVANCGAVGRKCPSSYSNGSGSICSNGVCQPQSCNAGFGFDYSAQRCRDVTSDSSNCGSVGNVCAFPHGSGSCSNGVCSMKSCSNGFALANGACTKVDTVSDAQNCGSVGNVCSYPNGVAACKSGTCVLDSCQSGYELKTSYFLFWPTTTTCEPLDTSADTQNCGAIGNVCAVENGQPQCVKGVCSAASCNNGYNLVDGTCVGVDTTSDSKNCGGLNIVCPTSYKNGGAGVCINGHCQTACNLLFDFDFGLGFCRDVSSDNSNCGRCGQTCSLSGAKATSCRSGKCYATACDSGFTLSNGACTQTDTTSDVNNCGAVGNACQFSPSGASGVCKNSQCLLTSCPAGYALTAGVCVKQTASQAARIAKRDKVIKPKSLCPGKTEKACPILGSTSYAAAVEHHFNAPTEFSGIMLGQGGYECIDTAQALDSCGGCASTGEGVDCTRIRGAAGVGCEAGVCRVFSCENGWKPSLDGSKCVRVKAHSHGRNSTAAASHVRRHGPHHHHHHGAHVASI